MIIPWDELDSFFEKLREEGKTIVFTNGCFDIIHVGHVRYLKRAKELGDVLVVAVNSDRSVREIKGEGRPIVGERERAEILLSLKPVDYVTIFDDTSPLETIKKVKPHILVKGGDWTPETTIGREFVESYGGKVIIIPYVEGYSTTSIVKKIKSI